MAETKQRINSNIKLFEIFRKNVCLLKKIWMNVIQVNLDMTDHCTTDFCIWRTICLVPVRCISSIRHMYTTDFAYDGPIFLVPLSLSYPSSPVVTDRLFKLYKRKYLGIGNDYEELRVIKEKKVIWWKNRNPMNSIISAELSKQKRFQNCS